MRLDFRTARTLATPSVRGYRMVIGWECQRPFAALDRDDPEIGFDRLNTKGGCRVFQGPGCEYECAGCYAYGSAYDGEYFDGMSYRAERRLYSDAKNLGFTIGHSSRCAYPEGWKSVRSNQERAQGL
jgi:hypothetical protein